MVCLVCFETMTTFNELYGIVQKNHNFPIVSLIKCEDIKIKAEEPFDAGCLFVTTLQSAYDQSQIHEKEIKCEYFKGEVSQIPMLVKTRRQLKRKKNKVAKKSKTIKRTVNKVDNDEDYCPSRNEKKLFCERCKIHFMPNTYQRHMKLHELEGQVFQCYKCKKDKFRCYFNLKNITDVAGADHRRNQEETFSVTFVPTRIVLEQHFQGTLRGTKQTELSKVEVALNVLNATKSTELNSLSGNTSKVIERLFMFVKFVQRKLAASMSI